MILLRRELQTQTSPFHFLSVQRPEMFAPGARLNLTQAAGFVFVNSATDWHSDAGGFAPNTMASRA